MSNPTALVQKLWNYCNILRDDSLSYGDYVEQLTILLLLKMTDEQSSPPFDKPSAAPKEFARPNLMAQTVEKMARRFRTMHESKAAVLATSHRVDRHPILQTSFLEV